MAALRSLSSVPYKVCKWVYGRKVRRNCRVTYKHNYYSESHFTVGKSIDLEVTDSAVEVFLGRFSSTHPLVFSQACLSILSASFRVPGRNYFGFRHGCAAFATFLTFPA